MKISPVITKIFKLSKALTKLVKQSYNRPDLPVSLKQSCETRWNSNLETLKAIIKSKKPLIEVVFMFYLLVDH